MTDVLVIGDTFRCPEMRHEIPLGVPDPFVYLERDGARHVYVHSMEADRIRGVAPDIDRAPARGGRDRRALRAGPRVARAPARVAARACAHAGLTHAVVPSTFPSAYLDRIRRDGVELEVDQEVFDDRRRGQGRRGARRHPARAGGRRGRDGRGRGAPARGGERRRRALARRRAAHRRARQGGDAARLHRARLHEPRTSSSRPGRRAPQGTRWATARSTPATPSSSTSGPRDDASSCFADMTRTFVVGGAPTRCASGTR